MLFLLVYVGTKCQVKARLLIPRTFRESWCGPEGPARRPEVGSGRDPGTAVDDVRNGQHGILGLRCRRCNAAACWASWAGALTINDIATADMVAKLVGSSARSETDGESGGRTGCVATSPVWRCAVFSEHHVQCVSNGQAHPQRRGPRRSLSVAVPRLGLLSVDFQPACQ